MKIVPVSTLTCVYYEREDLCACDKRRGRGVRGLVWVS